MINKMKHIVYKTTNLITGDFYYGVHNGGKLGYLGSGVKIIEAINLYGVNNFTRRTVMIFPNAEQAYWLEKVIVNKSLLKNPRCLNLIPGGGSYGGNYMSDIDKFRSPKCRGYVNTSIFRGKKAILYEKRDEQNNKLVCYEIFTKQPKRIKFYKVFFTKEKAIYSFEQCEN